MSPNPEYCYTRLFDEDKTQTHHSQSYNMATPAGQAKAQALNVKLEGEARVAIDDIEKIFVRKASRDSLVCSVKCYDKACQTGSSDALEACVHACQQPHRHAHAVVQQASMFEVYVVLVAFFWFVHVTFFVSGILWNRLHPPSIRSHARTTRAYHRRLDSFKID